MRLVANILISIILTTNCFSHNKWEVKSGITYGYFTNVNNKSYSIGYLLGISKRINIHNNFQFIPEIDWVVRGASLKDVSIQPYTSEKATAYVWNVDGKLGYIELPLMIKYNFLLTKKYFLSFYAGPSYSIPLIDFTKCKKKKFLEVFDPNNPSQFKYDYSFLQESGFGNNNSNILLNIGFQIHYLYYLLDVRYLINNDKNYWFDNITPINSKINSFYILFGLQF